ncbi:MAG: trigger factor [bacterium]
MKVNVSQPESCKIVLDVELPEDIVKQEVTDSFSRIQQEAALPGFRKGKAPMDMVKQNFSHQARQYVIEKLVPEAINRAIKENNINPIFEDSISVHDLKFEFDKPLTFKTWVEVKPKIEPKDYKKIKVEKKRVKVNEEELNKNMEILRENNAMLVLSLHPTVQDGDFVVVDYEGPILSALQDPAKIDRKKNQLIKINDESVEKYFPGFTKALVGAKSGERKEVRINFPADHKHKGLAGKEGLFRITVQEIKEKKLPEVNDDFAKELGFENLGKLKEKINENLIHRQETEINHAVEGQIVTELIKNNTLECPPSMVEHEIDYLVSRTKNYFTSQGLTADQMGIKDEDMRAKSKEDAEKRVKVDLILDAIAVKENISISDEEWNQQIEETVKESKNKTPEEVKQYFVQYREAIIAQMKAEKTFKFLLDNAKVKEID